MAASTPENKVKAQIKACIERFPGVYSNHPVPAGYGTPMLDVIGCYRGLFFAIEAKAPGKKPTPRQKLCIAQMQEAGGAVFVVDGPTSLEKFERWLDAVRVWNGTGLSPTQAVGNS